ncbi:membrane protein of unknown function [Candidatus Promineifilum breve]|uniref:Glycosyltransferase RgtA/B/C/D-like domain-containing protein n=1 Tax=Candidatus Promineifilum breve TaxID=1806508 RepID=A0A160T040_9CHLR|nr:hypothetical protein [Candidatus Promineifilum breve]CUS03251.2 membrane protein of unknown function [Candidatus Promineifilum breve]
MGEGVKKGRGAGEQGGRGDHSPLLPRSPAPLRRLWLLLPPLAALWLYRRALGFAYFNDDPTGHFAWMEGQTVWQFFAGSADYGYYRPVVFAVLRLSQLLFGNATLPHNPVADHTLLLLLHAANTALVAALALALTRRAGRPPAFALVAALVFAGVPFSYEAVGYVASLTHPLLVFWALLAITNYELRIRNEERALHAPRATRYLPLLFLSLGLLTHENGLFIFPALVGFDWATRPGASWPARARRLWPYAIPPALFAVLWLLIPKNSAQGLNSLADVGRNLVPFLQTLVYPLLPLVRLDAGDTTALLLLAAFVVSLSGLFAWRAGALRLWVFALGWFGLSLLPAALFLGPEYVYGSPRLSYLPGIGVALLWAMPVLWVAGGGWRVAGSGWRVAGSKWRVAGSGSRVADGKWQVAGLFLSVAYGLALVLPARPFIRCQLDFYEATSHFARQMAAVGRAAPAGRDLVFINLPFFFSSTAARPDGCPSPYPWTPVGGVLVPPYAQPRDFVRFNGGPDRPVEGVTFPGYGPGWRTFGPEIDGETLRGHATADAPFVFDLLNGSFADLADAWQPGRSVAASPRASFGGALALTDARLQEEGDTLIARLAWRVVAATEAPLAAFVHVYDAAGALVAQSDGPPGGGLAPQALWRPGDGLGDTRHIDLGPLPLGAYTVAVGVYNAADGVRLAAESAGQPLPDNVYRVD